MINIEGDNLKKNTNKKNKKSPVFLIENILKNIKKAST